MSPKGQTFPLNSTSTYPVEDLILHLRYFKGVLNITCPKPNSLYPPILLPTNSGSVLVASSSVPGRKPTFIQLCSPETVELSLINTPQYTLSKLNVSPR